MFLMFSICFCGMDGSSWMLGWCVKRREFQRAIPGIKNIVPCATWNKDGISHTKAAFGIQLFSASTHADKRLSLLYTEELICVRMHLHADLAKGRNIH